MIIAAGRKSGTARNAVHFRIQLWWNEGRSIMLPVFREVRASVAVARA